MNATNEKSSGPDLAEAAKAAACALTESDAANAALLKVEKAAGEAKAVLDRAQKAAISANDAMVAANNALMVIDIQLIAARIAAQVANDKVHAANSAVASLRAKGVTSQ